MERKKLTLSDFMYMEVKRTGDSAELIFANYNDDETKPVRLLGFAAPAYLSDFEVREMGHRYFQELVEMSDEMREERNNAEKNN